MSSYGSCRDLVNVVSAIEVRGRVMERYGIGFCLSPYFGRVCNRHPQVPLAHSRNCEDDDTAIAISSLQLSQPYEHGSGDLYLQTVDFASSMTMILEAFIE
mmetsp:Transcript_49935/g.60332  ORF Transcript_49935/g.60332 Transcript_49935/m.60332 type:complete len:101 (-) Transcript_49935:180-482(-)